MWVDPVSVEQLGQLGPTFPWGVLLLNRWYKKDPTPVRRLTNTLQNPTRFARFSIEVEASEVYKILLAKKRYFFSGIRDLKNS